MLGLRHTASGVNATFGAAGLTFGQHAAHLRGLLRQFHADRNEQEALVAGNAPFELFPEAGFVAGRDHPFRRGMLLTHGLSDSPYQMRHLAAFFRRQGFRVMVLLLPGHGTRPGDLLQMRWQEWAKTVAWGADCLAAEADELYLGGYSAGAALSLLHAASDKRVRGLFLYSPALEIDARARYANLHRLYSWLLPEAAWLQVLPDRDTYKYESFCLNAVAQMHALTRMLPQQAPDMPLFVAASADDSTVHAAATLRFMQDARHPASHLLWYARQRTKLPRVQWVDSALLQQRILSSAHTGIVMSPEDAHYGAAGDYANCLHYHARDEQRYLACLRARDAWLGELGVPAPGLLRRLMFNPHYAQLETAMQEFIGDLP